MSANGFLSLGLVKFLAPSAYRFLAVMAFSLLSVGLTCFLLGFGLVSRVFAVRPFDGCLTMFFLFGSLILNELYFSIRTREPSEGMPIFL
jgi:hypothetical protein